MNRIEGEVSTVRLLISLCIYSAIDIIVENIGSIDGKSVLLKGILRRGDIYDGPDDASIVIHRRSSLINGAAKSNPAEPQYYDQLIEVRFTGTLFQWLESSIVDNLPKHSIEDIRFVVEGNSTTRLQILMNFPSGRFCDDDGILDIERFRKIENIGWQISEIWMTQKLWLFEAITEYLERCGIMARRGSPTIIAVPKGVPENIRLRNDWMYNRHLLVEGRDLRLPPSIRERTENEFAQIRLCGMRILDDSRATTVWSVPASTNIVHAATCLAETDHLLLGQQSIRYCVRNILQVLFLATRRLENGSIEARSVRAFLAEAGCNIQFLKYRYLWTTDEACSLYMYFNSLSRRQAEEHDFDKFANQILEFVHNDELRAGESRNSRIQGMLAFVAVLALLSAGTDGYNFLASGYDANNPLLSVSSRAVFLLGLVAVCIFIYICIRRMRSISRRSSIRS